MLFQSLQCFRQIRDTESQMAETQVWRFVTRLIVAIRLFLGPMYMEQLQQTKRVRDRGFPTEYRQIFSMMRCLQIAEETSCKRTRIRGENSLHSHQVDVELQGLLRITHSEPELVQLQTYR